MNIKETLITDVVIVGGGPSGIIAAKTLAKAGYEVILIERYGFLGGSTTNSLVIPMMTFHAGKKQIIKGYAQDLIDRLKINKGTIGHIKDPLGVGSTITPIETEVYKYISQEYLLEDGVDIKYYTEAIDIEIEEEIIKNIIVKTRSGFYKIEAKRYIDASGDGDIVSMAGEDFLIGREKDGKCQPMSMMFKVGNIDREKIIKYSEKNPEQFVISKNLKGLRDTDRIAISGYFDLVKMADENNDLNINRDRVLFFELNNKSEILVNMSRIINKLSVKDFELSEATIEGRRQIFKIMNFLKKYIPGFENSKILESGVQIGVRESRRIDGLYTLTEEDILNKTIFEDTIALGSWPIDVHDPDGANLNIKTLKMGEYYGIPYRCLVPKKIKNLVVSGRIISVTHEALASVRVTPICMALGQASGCACLESLKEDLYFKDLDIKKLRMRLIETGQILE